MADNKVLHGVNLTGWLVLEPWVTPELFEGTGSLGEESLLTVLGGEFYADVVIKHRASFITEKDFSRIAERGFNAVRIPVPWYAFGSEGPDPGPRVGCLSELDNALTWAADNGIRVLLALSVSPGAPGCEDALQSGAGGHREDILTVIAALAKRYAEWPAFFGIEVADQPRVQRRQGFSMTDGVQPHVLRNFYRDAYATVRCVAGPEPVVVLPDAGMPNAWRSFMAPKRYRNVWLDCRLYHHADHIDATGPAGSRELVERSRKTLRAADKSGLPVMVGGWSGALPFADSLMTPEGQIALERVYIADQIAAFADRPAWFFQTWKTSGRLSGWDSRIALASFEKGIIG